MEKTKSDITGKVSEAMLREHESFVNGSLLGAPTLDEIQSQISHSIHRGVTEARYAPARFVIEIFCWAQ
jgi:hypothetical protein